MGWVKSTTGDVVAQGVVDYPNHDIYNYGGRTPIRSKAKEASFDLSETASHGYNYYKTVKGYEPPAHVDKEYHEKVNDYTKNISNAIFSPGITF